MRRVLLLDLRRLAALSVLFLLALLPFARRPTDRHAEADLRDAVASPPPLSPAHAALGRDGRSSCGQCHGEPATRSPYLPVWGGAAWKPEAPAAPSSRTCLSCHDDALAGGAVHKDSHPIGMDYAAARARSPDRLNDLAGHPEVKLDDGKVGCLSCHAIHVPAGDARRASAGSTCETCHRL